MTTQHEEESRRSGGFRDAVNELFGRGERGDGRDTSQLDALDREEAQRHGEDAGYAGVPQGTPGCRDRAGSSTSAPARQVGSGAAPCSIRCRHAAEDRRSHR